LIISFYTKFVQLLLELLLALLVLLHFLLLLVDQLIDLLLALDRFDFGLVLFLEVDELVNKKQKEVK
jgi:hypothetical protein